MDTFEALVRQDWVESERGWGVRPDGYSLHLTSGDRDAFVKDYWDTMPNEAPDEYSRPDGEPRMVTAGSEIAEEVRASKNGVRYSPSGRRWS